MSDERFHIHLSAQHMSGRVVEFRVLDTGEIEACNRNGAVQAGDAASRDELRVAQIKQLVATMITRYTIGRVESKREAIPADKLKPGSTETTYIVNGVPDPESLKKAKWQNADYQSLLLGKGFSAKEFEVLRMLYTEHHELSHAEVMVLSGKAHPAPTGD